MNTNVRIEILDRNFGYTEEERAEDVATRLLEAGVRFVGHGEWGEICGFSEEAIDWVPCSRCGKKSPDWDYSFCPFCGADMRSHKVIVKGKCTACGKPLGENDGLFLCAECQKKNNEETRSGPRDY